MRANYWRSKGLSVFCSSFFLKWNQEETLNAFSSRETQLCCFICNLFVIWGAQNALKINVLHGRIPTNYKRNPTFDKRNPTFDKPKWRETQPLISRNPTFDKRMPTLKSNCLLD